MDSEEHETHSPVTMEIEKLLKEMFELAKLMKEAVFSLEDSEEIIHQVYLKLHTEE